MATGNQNDVVGLQCSLVHVSEWDGLALAAQLRAKEFDKTLGRIAALSRGDGHAKLDGFRFCSRPGFCQQVHKAFFISRLSFQRSLQLGLFIGNGSVRLTVSGRRINWLAVIADHPNWLPTLNEMITGLGDDVEAIIRHIVHRPSNQILVPTQDWPALIFFGGPRWSVRL